MAYTAALKEKRCVFLQKLLMTEYFKALIPLGDAGVKQIQCAKIFDCLEQRNTFV